MVSCAARTSLKRTVKFSPKQDEITTTPSLKNYLANNPQPKIVLRTGSRMNSDNITEKENNIFLYNAIESEFLKSGFIVRDRQLFEKIVANSENNNNYGNLQEKSDTDLIIEITDLDRSIKYSTNTYYDSNGEKQTSSVLEQEIFYGATIEFKVIMINTNEFAGLYKFNYVPCITGCEYGGTKERMTKREKDEMKAYEITHEDRLIAFVKNAIQELINEMKK